MHRIVGILKKLNTLLSIHLNIMECSSSTELNLHFPPFPECSIGITRYLELEPYMVPYILLKDSFISSNGNNQLR